MWRVLLSWFLVLCLAGGCAADAPEPDPAVGDSDARVVLEGDSDPRGLFVLDGLDPVRDAFLERGAARFVDRAGRTFWRAGLRFDALDGDPQLAFRVRRGTTWSAWQPLAVTWHEGVAYNAAVELEDAPADALELRGDIEDARLAFVLVQLRHTPAAPEPLALTTPPEPDARYATLEQPLAAPSFVNPRSAWGARSTGTCGSPHWPSYVTIHHTVTPNNDTMSPEARMRQIQAFHIDSNNWCDIGYHFVVSQDGRIWQGRASHERSAAHVGNHNANNVGISFMGNFQEAQVPQAMLDGTRPLVDWLMSNYGIARNRSRLLGHQEWSGQSTACPGQHLLGRLEELLATTPPPDPEAGLPQGCRSDSSFAGAFCDDETHWAEPEHDYLAARGVTNGCSAINGKPAFCPQDLATRAHAIVFFGRISGMPTAGHPAVFTDLDTASAATRDYANAAAAYGITTGCGSSGTTFCPNDPLSRSALAAFIVRTWQLPPATQDHFDDDTGSVFEDVHNRLAEAGVTTGCGDREFCGGNEVTRAVLAVMLARAHRLGLPPVWELPPACLEGATFDPAFCDDDGHRAETAIDHLAALGVTNGCGELNGKPIYCPDSVASRQAGIIMLGRATAMPTEGHPPVFDDIASEEALRYANAAAALGITTGCGSSGTTFCPTAALSRSALAAFIVRAWALPPAAEDYFDDDAGHPFEDHHNRLAEAGITSGCATRAFCGPAEATRGVLAIFLTRALALGLAPAWEQADPPALPIVTLPDPDAEPTPTADGEGELPGELPDAPIGEPPTDPGDPVDPVDPGDPGDPGNPADPPATGGGGADGGCSIAAPAHHAPAMPLALLLAALLVGAVLQRRR